MLTLYIGDKNLSSWSLRAWLALTQAGAAFEEVVIRLDQPDTGDQLRRLTPHGKVPALRDGELVVWESLAICEYAAELQPDLWPEARDARAVARSVSHEMHAGFATLRREHPMNIAWRERRAPSPETRAELDRIEALWRDCRRRFGAGGPFLFGRFSIADAMYAPVATRIVTYDLPVGTEARAYVDALHALPSLQRWIDGARAEVGSR